MAPVGDRSPQRCGFPFAAVVGHDDLRLALLLTAVHPGIGGVLVRGEKGTAKSTVVRALAALLPAVAVVAACRFGCDPAAPDPDCPDGPHPPGAPASTRPARLVELPVGATEDRVIGSLDLERALARGVAAFAPGLLAAAHRGVLYVDEVNLLHDHLVDVLLDAAAMGRCHVERDGVSVSHAASFLLVGTMNPEEGELRPQLLDRFGLTVGVAASRQVDTRAEVVRRRLAYESDPAGFARGWRADEAELAVRIAAARARLRAVGLPDAELRRIAAVCAAVGVDGMRADLVMARTAIAAAAWRGAAEVTEEDVRTAAALALPHRQRDPFDAPQLDPRELDEVVREAGRTGTPPDRPDGPGGGPDDGGGAGGDPDGGPATPAAGGSGGAGGAGDRCDGPGSDDAPPPVSAPAFRARLLAVPGVGEGDPGRRSAARGPAGRVVRASRWGGTVVHLPATVTAAAPHQLARGRSGGCLLLRPADLRRAVREGREANLVVFAVDASGSMAARQRMSAVSGAVLSLLRDAYQRRDKVGLVTFRGDGAQVALPPTSSVQAAVARLTALRTGGRTPLAQGLLRARRVLAAERLRDPRRRALLVVVTDGRATVGLGGDPVGDAVRAAALLAGDAVRWGAATVVVDCESGPVRLGLAGRLADAAGGLRVGLDELAADRVAGVVRAARAVRAG